MNIIKQAHPTLASIASAKMTGPRSARQLAQVEIEPRTDAETAPGDPADGQEAPRQDGLPATVELDLEHLERCGTLVSMTRRSALSEEFRQIKRPLLMNARHRDAAAHRSSLIMVTSALPGEGKTFFSMNLAMSMAAEIDTSVLLVDADVIQPELLRRLGVNAELGLLDMLTRSDLNLSDVVLQTNVPKLLLLPSGTPHHLSTEMLASDAMEALLLSLVATYPDRIVIFDVPPLLSTNEGQVLATRVGQVVMVVEASGTPTSAVAEAFAMLDNCPLVMAVLNKAHESPVARGYGRYHG